MNEHARVVPHGFLLDFFERLPWPDKPFCYAHGHPDPHDDGRDMQARGRDDAWNWQYVAEMQHVDNQ